MKKDYFILAIKSLKHRGIRSWLTLIGIFIGVLAVVSLIGLGDGLKSAVSAQFGISATNIITVQAGGITFGPPGSGASIPLTTKDMDEIKRAYNVDDVLRRNIRSFRMIYNKKMIVAYGTNIEEGEKRKLLYEYMDSNAEYGRLLKDGDSNRVVLGHNFYVNKAGLDKKIDVGDKIELNGKTFNVVGIMDKKGSFIFDNIILMEDEEMKNLLNYGDVVDTIIVNVRDSSQMQRTKESIEKTLRQSRKLKEGEEDFIVSTPESALKTINSVLNGVQAFIVIIALISVFVGAIGIVNTMTTSVMERKKEIGIMKAVGAKNSQIFYQFLIESGLLGMVGGTFGVLFGTLISFLGTKAIGNYIGSSVSVTINWILIILVLIGSFLIGAISGISPAMKAAKQNPVEVLRG